MYFLYIYIYIDIDMHIYTTDDKIKYDRKRVYIYVYIYIHSNIYIYKWMQNLNWRSLKALASRSRVFLSLINLYRALCNYTYITEKFDVECAMPVKLFLVVSVHTIIWLYWKAENNFFIFIFGKIVTSPFFNFMGIWNLYSF